MCHLIGHRLGHLYHDKCHGVARCAEGGEWSGTRAGAKHEHVENMFARTRAGTS